MLASLSVSNIVLIEQLTLNFEPGLTVLTGENWRWQINFAGCAGAGAR